MPTDRPKALVVADVPSPHQNVFFDAIAELGEVDLEVVFCRRFAPGRAWSGAGPKSARHEFLPEFRARGLPLNPTLVKRLAGDHERLPFLIGYYLPGMLAAGLYLGSTRRRWAFWTDTLEPQQKSLVPSKVVGRLARRWFLGRSTGVLTTGERGRQALLANGVSEERAFEIPFVIDQAWIESAVDRERPNRDHIRHKFDIPSDARLLLFVGQLIRRKGIDLLLEAIADLPSKTNLHLIVVGDGPELPALKALVHRQALDTHVHFLPNTYNSELPPLWAAADAFVLPSRFDAWPVVVVEALTAGLPVIGSDACGSVVDRVQEGHSGWVFRREDVDALRAKLLGFLQLPVSDLHDMRRQARDRMRSFSPLAMAKRFTDVTRALRELPVRR